MLTVGVHEARKRFSELLDSVANGAIVIVTRYGTPVAALVPVSHVQHAGIAEAIRDLKEFGRGRSLDVPILEAMEDGRR